MKLHPRAGMNARSEDLLNIPDIVAKYYVVHPDPQKNEQEISFGTSGHRGRSLDGTFNEDHLASVCQALAEYRLKNAITGPLIMGKDTHALSQPAEITALEVFTANGITVLMDDIEVFTPTPVISHAILSYNKKKPRAIADGVVITPSHNPPGDGGFKYNPPHGGPAGPEVTNVIQGRANEILRNGLRDVKRIPFERTISTGLVKKYDFSGNYISDLGTIIRMEAIADIGLRIGVDPLGGAAFHYWDRIADRYHLNIQVVRDKIDPSFSFMSLDHDGKVRMDCSSPYAMAQLIDLKDKYDIACGNDPDADRHGIVTRSVGLMNPNHYLSVAIDYLFRNRAEWGSNVMIGKTLVSSSMIDNVAKSLNRTVAEVPVGFKWFVDGLFSGKFGFGGEESAGASFLRQDGKVWTTDKDGIILNLLAAEIAAVTGKDPGEKYLELENNFGKSSYKRIDAPANIIQKKALSNLSPSAVKASFLAGQPIVTKMTKAPFNNALIGGLKVVAKNCWFAARPSGTEEIYKIYAESFLGDEHLAMVIEEAQEMVNKAIKGE